MLSLAYASASRPPPLVLGTGALLPVTHAVAGINDWGGGSPTNDNDVLRRGGEAAVRGAVENPCVASAVGVTQAPLVLVEPETRAEIEHVDLYPNTVLIHVYDLKRGFCRANEMLAFNDRLAVGGVFHVGLEVYGSEWTYGSSGVSYEVPRTTKRHVYNCSLYLGNTDATKEDVALMLFQLCQEWPGSEYEILNRNCCSFATELCDYLDVGPPPGWINRFAKMLHRGRAAAKFVSAGPAKVSRAITRQAKGLMTGMFLSSGGGDASPTSSCASPIHAMTSGSPRSSRCFPGSSTTSLGLGSPSICMSPPRPSRHLQSPCLEARSSIVTVTRGAFQEPHLPGPSGPLRLPIGVRNNTVAGGYGARRQTSGGSGRFETPMDMGRTQTIAGYPVRENFRRAHNGGRFGLSPASATPGHTPRQIYGNNVSCSPCPPPSTFSSRMVSPAALNFVPPQTTFNFSSSVRYV